jgi:hypothetical protein
MKSSLEIGCEKGDLAQVLIFCAAWIPTHNQWYKSGKAPTSGHIRPGGVEPPVESNSIAPARLARRCAPRPS